ncbi:MAG: helix-turn-helix domain containing protein [Leptospirales bacterium]|nr:helix-turn-helix domain containing protein [Leptospirales bacterium]
MTAEQRTERIMKRINVSRQELSATLGISLSSVAMYFTGHHRIRKVVALAIQASYGISAEWILSGKKPIFIKQAQGRLSNEAMEVALMYHNLPRRLQPVARTTMQAYQRLKENASS